jgi:hypothetical protein
MEVFKCLYCDSDVNPETGLPKRGPKKSKFCSKTCNSNLRVDKWRERTKIRAVEYLGGKCARCGYSKCMWALQFHHRDPEMKKFTISSCWRHVRSWDVIQQELDKCTLLCANCHAEEEDRLRN